MSVRNLTTKRGAGLVVLAGLFALLCVAPLAIAQMSDFGNPGELPKSEIGVGDPPAQTYCVGNRCPGQTCDETNDRCVGDVTLQAPMGAPVIGLTMQQRQRFETGRIEFDVTFQEADGLGPVFNQDGCGSCHNNPIGGSGTITVLRFGVRNFATDEFDPLADMGGSLLNQQSISPECAEIIPVPPTNWASNRLTNSTLGFGLVEAIPDPEIEFNAINPPSGDVSGRAIIVPLLEEPGMTAIGRFGWKDQLATVLSFSADASLQEMGITSRIFPEDNAPNNDPVLLAMCDTVPDPESVPGPDGREFIDRVTDFQRFLAPPPQTPRSGMTGEALFNDVGCTDCHLGTAFATPGSPDDDSSSDDDGPAGDLEPALRGQLVRAYSDFLLHDMGDAADFIEQGGAGPRELRTPPIWGLRVRDPLWHDGRVAGGTFSGRMTAAIAQHDATNSEGQASAQAFFALSMDDRNHVIAFLDSLGKREFDLDGDGLVDLDDRLLFDGCYTGAGAMSVSPDDPCAVADADQDFDVDDDDLELLDVVLNVMVDDEDEDSDDESNDSDDSSGDGDDETGDGDGYTRDDIVAEGGDGNTDSGLNGPAEESDDAADVEDVEPGASRTIERRGRTVSGRESTGRSR